MMVVFCGGKGSWCLHTEEVRHEIYDVIHLLTHPLTMYGGLVRLCSHGTKSAPPMVCIIASERSELVSRARFFCISSQCRHTVMFYVILNTRSNACDIHMRGHYAAAARSQ